MYINDNIDNLYNFLMPFTVNVVFVVLVVVKKKKSCCEDREICCRPTNAEGQRTDA